MPFISPLFSSVPLVLSKAGLLCVPGIFTVHNYWTNIHVYFNPSSIYLWHFRNLRKAFALKDTYVRHRNKAHHDQLHFAMSLFT